MSKDKGIRISEKHGVNPSVTICCLCGKDVGLALHGRLPGDEQAPRQHFDDNPCEECQKQIEGYKKLGFVFFIIDDTYERMCKEGKTPRSPWLFFAGLQVIKRDSPVFNAFHGVDLSKGAAFIGVMVASQLGLWPIAEAKK